MKKRSPTKTELYKLIDLYKSLIVAEQECTTINISLLMSFNHFSETIVKRENEKKLNGEKIITINEAIKHICKDLKMK